MFGLPSSFLSSTSMIAAEAFESRLTRSRSSLLRSTTEAGKLSASAIADRIVLSGQSSLSPCGYLLPLPFGQMTKLLRRQRRDRGNRRAQARSGLELDRVVAEEVLHGDAYDRAGDESAGSGASMALLAHPSG